jgi:PKHD-type hydroxylase
MLLHIPDILTPAQIHECRAALDAAPWVDGRATAGFQSAQVKHNTQVPEDHPAAKQLGDLLLTSLERTPLFIAAALPLHVFPPLFNRYESGDAFGTHVDNAIRQSRQAGVRIRTDLSATLFLNAPEEYDGGELVIEDHYGAHSAKLPAGHMVLYPASSLHHVRPVTRGVRIASFFWIQSMLRSDEQRTLLFDLDTALQQLSRDVPDHPSVVRLTGVYHNLLRVWADV